MANRDDILWFKRQFQPQIEPLLRSTPLTVDFITAIACQETGAIWSILRKKPLKIDRILALCVGDTLDADRGRKAFPATKAELLRAEHGLEMFQIAHQALVDMAAHVPGYAGVAQRPNKFCHGFGLFQLDLQFFLDDAAHFLQKRYERFDKTLEKCLLELNRALKKLGFDKRSTLCDLDLAAVGIVYNSGSFKPRKGLKQGHFDGSRYYGEALFDFLRLAHTVALPGATPALPAPRLGQAIVPPPTPVTATGPAFRVSTKDALLRVRSSPRLSKPSQANVIGNMPDGHPVRAVTGKPVNNFIEIETSLAGAFLRGFASRRFLVRDTTITGIPLVEPATQPPISGIARVWMPRKAGRVTKRRDFADAHSLNEPGQPMRRGSTAEELRKELIAIIDWLAVEKPSHKRYLPHDGLTFCNIYSHDYCHLAGVYLPRVWWTSKALAAIIAGETVKPLIGDTIEEVRANALFRWLRDFGSPFGWRQTGSLTTLQQAVNQGAVGLIVARRRQDGRSGHIVVVVPEAKEGRARRAASGEVTAPLQSQAGTTNFRYGNGKANWWNDVQFAESALWFHA